MKRFIIISVTLLLAGAFPGLGQDIDSKKDERARLLKEVETLDKQLKAVSGKSADATKKVTLLNAKIESRKKLVDEADRRLKRIDNDIYLTQKNINSLKKDLDTMTDYYGKLVRTAYGIRDTKMWYLYVLGSDNMQMAARRMAYFKNLSSMMNDRAEEIMEAKDKLEESKKKMEGLRAEARAEKARRTEDLNALAKEQNEARRLVASLQKDLSKYKSQIDRKRKEINNLNAEIEKLIAAQMKASSSSSSSGKATPADPALSDKFESNKGKLGWPVNGPVVEKFGQHYHPVYKNIKLPFNNGITIATEAGEKACAVFDGVVKQIVVMPGYNQCVLVQHGKYFTFYCKLGSVAVRAGDKVKTGQLIGIVDTIDSDTRFHFQLWKERAPQDPELWLRKR